ncbi:MAG TPA: hypothetical protein PJ998_02350, partial [Terrimesophilobacter sp.]|nr:hypothetical protein [Terrimesophilobacter sp.]
MSTEQRAVQPADQQNGTEPAEQVAGKRTQEDGLRITRRFSTEGIHPYDEVEWERRDVEQTNWKTGET